ncbi:MAG: hydrogen peroxide-inducible genes activator [Pseudomonadota bacterium]
MNFTLRQLEYFLAIADRGSFRRAADQLDVTQPTLTGQIAALERELEISLFERSRSGTTLTPAGRELLDYAQRVLEHAHDLGDAAQRLSGHGVGTYRLGVTPTLGPYLLPHILPGLHRAYTSLQLYVREATPAELEDGLSRGEYDLILSTLPINESSLEVEPLFLEPLQLVVSRDHRLAGKKQVDRADLRGESVLTLDDNHLYTRQINELCERLGAAARRDYEGTSLDTLRHMVVMGMGVAFLPSLYVLSEINRSDYLEVTSVAGASMQRQHAFAWRARSPARALFRELANHTKELVDRKLGKTVVIA